MIKSAKSYFIWQTFENTTFSWFLGWFRAPVRKLKMLYLDLDLVWSGTFQVAWIPWCFKIFGTSSSSWLLFFVQFRKFRIWSFHEKNLKDSAIDPDEFLKNWIHDLMKKMSKNIKLELLNFIEWGFIYTIIPGNLLFKRFIFRNKPSELQTKIILKKFICKIYLPDLLLYLQDKSITRLFA